MKQRDKNEILAHYRAGFSSSWSDQTPVEAVRFVVLDTETTGLDPRRDSIVSIGAIAVSECQIMLGDTFETMVQVRYNTAATLVHGITRDEARAGMAEADATCAFLDYLRDGVIVGHHIGHDIAMLDAVCERHFDLSLLNRHLDTGGLYLHLEHDGAFADQTPQPDLSLDGLCERFGIRPHDRHTAPGDAFLTAQIFLRLLRLAGRYGRQTLGALCEPHTTQEAISN